MRPGESLIDMARRHVAESEVHVERQRRLLARLSEHGLPTGTAEELMAEFQQSLDDHRDCLARIEQEQGAHAKAAAADPLGKPAT